MGIFDFFKIPDINQGIEEYKETEGAVLLDVRESYEYSDGHVPESINISLQDISLVEKEIADKNTPLFVYCLSGSRSQQAVKMLQGIGYCNVKNIGGIGSYKGEVER